MLFELFQALMEAPGNWQNSPSDKSLSTMGSRSVSGLNSLQNTPSSIQTPPQMNVSWKSTRRPLFLRVNLLQNGQRIAPRRDVAAAECPYKHTIIQKISECLGPVVTNSVKVSVHLPQGLRVIENDATWADALKVAQEIEWLDGELSVLIEF
jgi:hypothetical protein